MDKNTILITCGDPNGISYEIVLKAIKQQYNPDIVAVGSLNVFEYYNQKLDLGLKFNVLKDTDDARLENAVNLIDVTYSFDINPGLNSESAGRLAIDTLNKAIRYVKDGKSDIIITAPINKANISHLIPDFTGHTEFLANAFKVKEVSMMLTCQELTVVLVTTHLPIKDISEAITQSRIENTIIRTEKYLRSAGIPDPQIAVSGLNPHAGEQGLLGDDEIEKVIPAVKACKNMGINVEGPFPGDTMFVNFKSKPYHAYVCMYHDQGLIPLKMVGFSRSLNITLGLPFWRISVDHGTAYNIAGKGIADYQNMLIAINHAAHLLDKIKELK